MPILFQRFCRSVPLPRPSPIFGRFNGTGPVSHSKGRRVLLLSAPSPTSQCLPTALPYAPACHAPIQIQVRILPFFLPSLRRNRASFLSCFPHRLASSSLPWTVDAIGAGGDLDGVECFIPVVFAFLAGFKLISTVATMVLDSLSSPHRRSQNTFFVSSAKKPQSSRDDSWSALVERHRFLLTTLVVLAFLCTIYLYFAVTLGASDACAGLAGAERIQCQAKSVLQHGKLKFL
ncbi:hypothetical protein BAE44_0002228 [Dichanthelium oligosanthes]|uniref:Transmembrane protein n=1 Tax=Dichanthelium oligosanthes TaxID=888268 RepID=A0A1E5WH75_9POAL|nr:hypothetical protein BAE44_0002228 [Dichanthelium oligosanthes]